MRRRLLFLSLAAVLLASTVGSAKAATITYTSATIPSNTALPIDTTLAIQKFNTHLGTLESITFTLTTTTVGEIQIYNTTGSSVGYTSASASVPVTATGPGPTTLSDTATVTHGPGTAAPGLNTLPGMSSTSSSTTNYTGPLSDYEGPNLAYVGFHVSSNDGSFSGVGGNGKLFYGGNATAGGYITVTYTYIPAPVPEPTSMSLLGIGMVGFFTYRRLFKRHATV